MHGVLIVATVDRGPGDSVRGQLGGVPWEQPEVGSMPRTIFLQARFPDGVVEGLFRRALERCSLPARPLEWVLRPGHGI